MRELQDRKEAGVELMDLRENSGTRGQRLVLERDSDKH
jgi:hypothetical protein